ncbi:PilZ domain-containing protein [Croceicoccus mobilis]|nr:PilZ domain-containing protein [Croceicoccus mobilis]
MANQTAASIIVGQSGSDADFDRRAFPRSRSIYRPAIIETQNFSSFCMVKDLSPQGLMAETSARIANGQAVRVGFSENEMIAGSVAWSTGMQIGVQFDQNIDISQILIGSVAEESPTRVTARPPRLAVGSTASVCNSNLSKICRVLNVSTKGMRIECPDFKIGEILKIEVNNFARKKAIVRWLGEGEAGLEFLIALSYREAEKWAEELQSDQGAA